MKANIKYENIRRIYYSDTYFKSLSSFRNYNKMVQYSPNIDLRKIKYVEFMNLPLEVFNKHTKLERLLVALIKYKKNDELIIEDYPTD